MLKADIDFDPMHADIARFTTPDVLGFYTHFEATEIFVVRDDDHIPHNVFSILVAEERAETAIARPRYLGSRIRLNSLAGWAFGIKQTVRPIAELAPIFERFSESKEWRVSDQPLHVGALSPASTQFVPPDSTTTSPLNHVLKNNFWNGSYILELMDTTKTVLQPLFDEPKRLQELSAAVRRQIPISLASLSDRLGNVVVQFPITVQTATFAKNRLTGEAIINVGWHPQATPRPLRASCEMQFDNAITAYASTRIERPISSLPTADGQGMQRCVLWDDQFQVILAATEPTAFINTIGVTLQTSDPEPRIFTLKDPGGVERQIRVALSTATESTVTAPQRDLGEEWTRRRIYREEANRLAAQRRFVQYKPVAGQEAVANSDAIRPEIPI
ncbi:MAG: VPA1262 family N-terminal domain-containing protein [Candidatus Pacebacteria bacterium]|nr:VPA1262 family N-terminal domain-containing protein [Candidatus Paceibacterota bacterium]